MRSEKCKKKTEKFIETGSYIGNGIELALLSGFEKIYSIELSEDYFNLCSDKFRYNNKVELILGDSYYELKKLLNKYPDTSFTYWLDGHYSGGDTAFGVEETPIIKELESILSRNVGGELIYIDDMRLYRDMNKVVNIKRMEDLIRMYKPDCKCWFESTSFDSKDIFCLEY